MSEEKTVYYEKFYASQQKVLTVKYNVSIRHNFGPFRTCPKKMNAYTENMNLSYLIQKQTYSITMRILYSNTLKYADTPNGYEISKQINHQINIGTRD